MNLLDLFTNPQQCEIVLLSDYPSSTDAATFSRVTWPNYQPILTQLVMERVPGQGGLIYINVPFVVTTGFYLTVAYAILQNGICLFVGQLDPAVVNQLRPGLNILQARTILFISRFPA
jgi:hypothetical protein